MVISCDICDRPIERGQEVKTVDNNCIDITICKGCAEIQNDPAYCTKLKAYCEEGKALQREFLRLLAIKDRKEWDWGPENSQREQRECEVARKAWYGHVKQCLHRAGIVECAECRRPIPENTGTLWYEEGGDGVVRPTTHYCDGCQADIDADNARLVPLNIHSGYQCSTVHPGLSHAAWWQFQPEYTEDQSILQDLNKHFRKYDDLLTDIG